MRCTILIRTKHAKRRGQCFAAGTTYFGMGRIELMVGDIITHLDLLIFDAPTEVIPITDDEFNNLRQAELP